LWLSGGNEASAQILLRWAARRAECLVEKLWLEIRRLDDSLREVRRLDEAHKAIEVHWRRRANMSYFVEKFQRAQQSYEQTQSNEDLEAVLLAECVMEKARQRAGIAQQQITFGIISEEFRSKYPDHCEALQKAVELQVRVAIAELNRIGAKETERLRAAGIDDAEDAKQSPIIKRAASEVEARESLLAKIKVTPIEDVWNQYASAVLSG
jgi:hypothetical protein